MSAYIKKDLESQLRAGQLLEVQPLTLGSLAAHYEVSFTPVRTAVAELIDEGLLEKGPDRRLRVITRPVRSKKKSGTVSRPEPPRDLYQLIANDLTELCLNGEAVALREEATAEQYGVSRTVIRGIFARLAGEGLLEHIPRRGWRLKPFQIEDLKAFTEVRVVLELKALELARPKLVAADLQRMLDANAPPESPDDPPRTDESLHDYFLELAGNPYLSDFLSREKSQYYGLLLKWEEARSRAISLQVAHEHREILTALLEHRWRAARKALKDHILGNNQFGIELNEIARSGLEDAATTPV